MFRFVCSFYAGFAWIFKQFEQMNKKKFKHSKAKITKSKTTVKIDECTTCFFFSQKNAKFFRFLLAILFVEFGILLVVVEDDDDTNTCTHGCIQIRRHNHICAYTNTRMYRLREQSDSKFGCRRLITFYFFYSFLCFVPIFPLSAYVFAALWIILALFHILADYHSIYLLFSTEIATFRETLRKK